MLPLPSAVRRRLLLLAAGGAWLPRARADTDSSVIPPPTGATLLAAWQAGVQQRIGLVALGARQWSIARSLEVPTRAHGLLAEPGGTVLAVARRPGDWLLRWHPDSGQTQWHWVEEERRFNGHAVTDAGAGADRQTLWTTETELEAAQGLLGVRELHSLAKRAEWPTHGRDPHQLMRLPRSLGDCPAGSLVVANGGIPTLPETGRARRRLDEMDASLAVLDARDGRLLGQWRLADRHLSIRHLAWDATSQRLGIALQAEHPDPQARQTAPLLALWDGRRLWPATGQPALAGYGGDIVALPAGGFAVSAPRADAVALFDANGLWRESRPFAGAYALARAGAGWWIAGQPEVLDAARGSMLMAARPGAGLEPRWDNHWVPRTQEA